MAGGKGRGEQARYDLIFHSARSAVLKVDLGLSRAAGKIEIRQLTPDRRFTGAGPETDGPREGENGGGVGRFIIARGAQRGINALK